MADTKSKAPELATREELAELRARPMASLTGRPATDVIGRELDWSDPDAARKQQRAAVEIRDARVAEDVERQNRGLPPKFATS